MPGVSASHGTALQLINHDQPLLLQAADNEEEFTDDEDEDMWDADSDQEAPLPEFSSTCSARGLTYITGDLHSYDVPSSTCHQQTADALSVHINADGSEEVMLSHGNKISLYKLPKDFTEEPVKYAEGAAGFLPYSTARSPDGQLVVAGE